MLDLELLASLLFCLLLPLLLFFSLRPSSSSGKLPKSYPLIGSYLAIFANRKLRIQWTSEVVTGIPSLTFVLKRPFGYVQVLTANPAVVQHMLKTHFHIYKKGDLNHTTLSDLLGNGIFNSDGTTWKFQRQFNTRSLRKFVEQVVDTELNARLLPILAAAAANKTVRFPRHPQKVRL
ncbi:hypothetical protein RJ639_035034 [Escallonia herrerae]|uniref:Cytochrome P450 n=1 Tax=Escallonia herrerae TaxID=1293975 RepID=A0AA89BH48_9ASTE|nr:hypothetical protein RJ639_035034 [Escallonia herrerae]